MRKAIQVGFVLGVFSFAPSGATAAGHADAALALGQAADFVCRTLAKGDPSSCSLEPVERTAVAGDVFRYSTRVRVGPGEHEVIGIHRVVREAAPFQPAQTSAAVMLVHGDGLGFVPVFMTSTLTDSVANEQSLVVFLAQGGLDVWGIDLRWTLVPGGTTDLSFMRDWNLATDLGDLDAGLRVARVARFLGGSGLGKMHLLGYSRGAQIGYAFVSEETEKPFELRQVRGFVPIDASLKSNLPAAQEAACRRVADRQALIDSGVFSRDFIAVEIAGTLALTDPDAPSPFLPGLSNRQFALLAGGPAPGPGEENRHFIGLAFDPSGIPSGSLYSQEELWFQFLRSSSPFQPLGLILQADEITCADLEGTEVDSPFDDHFDDITVPVLYVGAAGGAGEHGAFTATLLTQAMTTVYIGSVEPPQGPAFDIGHADIVLGENSAGLFWQVISDWLLSH